MKSKTAASPFEEESIDEEQLPEGWTLPKLGELIFITSGKSIKRSDYSKTPEKPYPVAGAGGPIGWTDKFNFPSPIITLGRVGSAGTVNVYFTNTWVTDNTLVLIPNEKILFPFLASYLRTIAWADLSTGSTQPLITQTIVKNIPIPLPPLAEQRRIVARVEALLSHVDAAGDRLSRVPAIMKRFRQSVLAAACEGRLTEEWREENPDIETSFRFLKRFFKGKVEPIANLFFNVTDLPDIPESWLWIEFGKIISELKNGVYLVGPNLEPPGNPILRISSVRPGKVSLDDIKYLPDSDQYIENFHLKDKDLLFTRYNGSLEFVGICGMVRDLQDRILLYPDKLIRVRFDQSGVMPEYAEMFFQSFNARTNIYSVIKSSAGQKGISGKDIKIQPFPLPPLAEQHEIVRRVGLLFERADAIEREVVAAGRRCERLRQAVMVKAFSGNL